VAIYGLGHLGSWVAMACAKLGIRLIHLFDFDTVELRNISGSVYEMPDIGKAKSVALRDHLLRQIIDLDKEFVPTTVFGDKSSMGYASRFTSGFPYQPFCNFYILATDNAESRKKIAETIFKHWDIVGHMRPNMKPVLIDVRSAGPKLTVLNISIKDETMRERYLRELDRLVEEPGDIACNASNIIQVPFFVSALVSQIITSFVRGEEEYKVWQGSLLDLTTYPFSLQVEEFLPA
jgi:molybdopterin/thiamine biosynthesis adenylyltransferase